MGATFASSLELGALGGAASCGGAELWCLFTTKGMVPVRGCFRSVRQTCLPERNQCLESMAPHPAGHGSLIKAALIFFLTDEVEVFCFSHVPSPSPHPSPPPPRRSPHTAQPPPHSRGAAGRPEPVRGFMDRGPTVKVQQAAQRPSEVLWRFHSRGAAGRPPKHLGRLLGP